MSKCQNKGGISSSKAKVKNEPLVSGLDCIIQFHKLGGKIDWLPARYIAKRDMRTNATINPIVDRKETGHAFLGSNEKNLPR